MSRQGFEITVEEFKAMLDAGTPHQLIDCREPYEFDIANIGGTLIPMREIPQHLNELSTESPLVIYCRTGSRSAMVTNFLQQNGFPNARNLAGGIYAWNDRIDPSVKKY